MLTGLRKIAEIHKGDMRLTANQNVIIANVAQEERAAIEAIVAQYSLVQPASGLRRNSMACVALPTCGLALAESERYLPDLIDRARRAARGVWPERRRHRHPHDRLPERLRAAVSGRDRFGRQRPRPLQPLSRRRVSTARACRSFTPRTCEHDGDHRGARSGVRRLREGARAGRALRRVRDPRGLRGAAPATARISMPTPERSAPHERSRVPPPAVRTTCPYCGVGCGVLAAPDGHGRRDDRGRSGASGEFRPALLQGRGARRNARARDAAAASDAAPRTARSRAPTGTRRSTKSPTASRASSNATGRTRSRSISRGNCSPRTITSPTS